MLNASAFVYYQQRFRRPDFCRAFSFYLVHLNFYWSAFLSRTSNEFNTFSNKFTLPASLVVILDHTDPCGGGYHIAGPLGLPLTLENPPNLCHLFSLSSSTSTWRSHNLNLENPPSLRHPCSLSSSTSTLRSHNLAKPQPGAATT